MNTAASLASSRSLGGSASSRALTTACTVGGRTARSDRARPLPGDMSMPVVSMMKNGFPPARRAISVACLSPIWPPPACLTRWTDSSAESGSSRTSTALLLLEPHAGRSSSRLLRASTSTSARRGPRRPLEPRRSIRSSIAGLSMWASSKRSSTGWSRASPSMSAMNPAWTSCTNADSSRRPSLSPKSSARRSTMRSTSAGSQATPTSSRSRRPTVSGGSS